MNALQWFELGMAAGALLMFLVGYLVIKKKENGKH